VLIALAVLVVLSLIAYAAVRAVDLNTRQPRYLADMGCE
jgi:Tfp pilus assembly protein PilX